MKNLNVRFLFVLVWSLMVISMGSCEDDDNNNDTTTTTGNTNPNDKPGLNFNAVGTLQLNFQHVFGNTPLEEAPKVYYTQTDSIKITELRYYVTNVTLTTQNGNKVNLKNYDLVTFTQGVINKITIPLVPAGAYKSLSFLIGVDSLTNSSGAQVGALDPSNGMFWTWNTGFIFHKILGRYSANASFAMDIGGDNNLMEVSFDLNSFKNNSIAPQLNLTVDVEKIFSSPNVYDLGVDDGQIHRASHPSIPKLKPNIVGSYKLNTIQ